MPVLLAVLRVLLNLTHDNELGSHRLGEQDGAVKTVLDIVFLVREGGREGEGGVRRVHLHLHLHVHVIVVSWFLQCMRYVPREGCMYFQGQSPRKYMYIQHEGGTIPAL